MPHAAFDPANNEEGCKDPMVIPTKMILRSELFQEGKASGQAKSVLRLLDLKKIEISPAQREQIASCTDLDLLDIWFDAAMTATGIADLTGLVV